MIRAIHIGSGKIIIDLVMNCPECPDSQAALDEIYHAVQTLAPDFSIYLLLLPEIWHPPCEQMFK
jgi:hypothetical protein